MLFEKIQLASRVGYLRLFGARSDIRADYDAAAETYDTYYSRNLIRASQPYIDKVKVPTGGKILDLACGTGFFTHLLAERVGPQGTIIAADISSGMLKRNREEAEVKGYKNITFVEGDAIALLREQPDASIDLINIGWGICYMDHKVLRAEAFRALKPGGTLSIIENKATTLHEVSKHFEQVLTIHPHALCKHMDVTLPQDSNYLAKTFAKDPSLTIKECYDGEVEVPCENGAEIVEYMTRSGASSGFLNALKEDQIDAVMDTFIKEADIAALHGSGLPRVVHEFAVLIVQTS